MDPLSVQAGAPIRESPETEGRYGFGQKDIKEYSNRRLSSRRAEAASGTMKI
jgi:hypothetical protein